MRTVFRYYLQAISHALKCWRICVLAFCIQLALGILVVSPLVNYLNSIIGNRNSLNIIEQRFDFNIIMDMLHAEPSIITISISLFMAVVIIRLVWQVFMCSGFSGCVINDQTSLSNFFGNAVFYFRHNLLISILVLIFYTGMGLLAVWYFSLGGLNVLHIDNELFLIQRAKSVIAALLLLSIFVDLVRDSSRVAVKSDEDRNSFRIIFSCCKLIFKGRFLVLAILNALIFLVLIISYLMILKLNPLHIEDWISFLLIQGIILLSLFLKISAFGAYRFLLSDQSNFSSVS